MFNASTLNLIEKLKASYWFIPAVMAVFAVILSFAATALDGWLGSEWPHHITWLHANRPEGARALLSTIAGSMITVAGVTFSMTIGAVSFATSQIGPRLISNFMRDRANQVTLGMFIATFLYCLMVLRTVVGAGESANSGIANVGFVPHVAILIAIMFAIASVAVLIYFIHHIPESINASNIIARVGNTLLENIADLFPENIGQPAGSKNDPKHTLPADFYQRAKPIASHVDGYIQMLQEDDLMEVAVLHDLILRIEYRPGDFAMKDDTLLYIYPAERVTDDIALHCHDCFAFGRERTQSQDVLFLVDELLEVIARALSPGVNDPYTAISAMDWLQCGLYEMASREITSAWRFDQNQRLRVLAHPVNFKSFADAVFDPMLPYVSRDRNAALRAMKMIGEIVFKTEVDEYRSHILKHAESLKSSAVSILPLESDRRAVENRYNDIIRALSDRDFLFELRNSNSWLGGTA